eukprot:4787743-Pleurochrysis_carterae.AAC.1
MQQSGVHLPFKNPICRSSGSPPRRFHRSRVASSGQSDFRPALPLVLPELPHPSRPIRLQRLHHSASQPSNRSRPSPHPPLNPARDRSRRLLSLAWLGWLALHDEIRRRHALCDPVIARLRDNQRCLAFDAWRDRVRVTRAAQTALLRALGAWRTALVQRCMRALASYVTRRVARRRANLLASWHRASTLASSHLRAWSAAYTERTREIGMVGRAVSAMVKTKAARALRQWRAAARANAALRHVLGATVARWRRLQLFEGWRQLATKAAERKETQRCLLRVVNKMRQLARTSALEIWRSRASARMAVLRAVSAVVASLRQAGARAALNKWVEAASAKAKLSHVAQLIELRMARGYIAHWREVSRRLRVCVRAAKTLTCRALAACWRSWLAHAAADAAAEEEAMGAAARCGAVLTKLEVAKAFRTLHGASQKRTQLRRMLRNLSAPRRVAAFRSWRDYAVTKSAQTELLRRAVSLFMGGLLTRCVRGWRRVSVRAAMVRLRVAKLMRALSARIVDAWATHTRKRRACMRAAAELLYLRRRAVCGPLLPKWVYATHVSFQLRVAASRLYGRSATAVFGAWARWAKEQARDPPQAEARSRRDRGEIVVSSWRSRGEVLTRSW